MQIKYYTYIAARPSDSILRYVKKKRYAIVASTTKRKQLGSLPKATGKFCGATYSQIRLRVKLSPADVTSFLEVMNNGGERVDVSGMIDDSRLVTSIETVNEDYYRNHGLGQCIEAV